VPGRRHFDMPPRDNPDSRNFLTRRIEDYRLCEEIDGIVWACEGPMRFRTLPGARHDRAAIDPGNVTCFCQVCTSKAKERGIDVEGARRGFPELEPSMRVLTLRAVSMMFVRVLARWIILERVFAGPSEFGHSGFRRIIRSTDPTLQIVEVVMERRSRFPRGFVLRILRLWTLVVVPAVAPILFRSRG
jgi:hypothetical protein